jgi:hypothetical protein
MSDPEKISLVVETSTRACLSAELEGNPPPESIDSSKTFVGTAAATSYRLTQARFEHVAGKIEADLRKKTHRNLRFSTDFLDEHGPERISRFIYDTTDLVMAASLIPGS